MLRLTYKCIGFSFLLIGLSISCKDEPANNAIGDDLLEALLDQEDTDGDKKITIEDQGPKEFTFKNKDGKPFTARGTYELSNVLQELVINDSNEIDSKNITEAPADRISRMIKTRYWDGLTRTMDSAGIEKLIKDTKNASLTAQVLPVYVPYNDTLAINYYKELEKSLAIRTVRLPAEVTPQYVASINDKPGILSLKLFREDGKIKGAPFVVPGGRFNEMYGWDSYFESIGLIIDGRVDLAKAMADNFQYEIENYGKILNANRSYYLTRTQPPFYTSLIKEVFEQTKDTTWLKSHLKTAIKEYETVWMVPGKRLTKTGLNRYLAEGIGITPETEEGHYDAVIKPLADKAGMSIEEYTQAYRDATVGNAELDDRIAKDRIKLDTYFMHDRTVRESGHDTSYRIEGIAADLAPVALNAFLYQYESDFAQLTKDVFGGKFSANDKTYTTAYWQEQAEKRKKLATQYLFNPEAGYFVDYNISEKMQQDFLAATTFTPLWSNMATKEQAEALIKNAFPKLKELGGIAASTKESRGPISAERPQRQWDYPNGWAPHQIMAWKGMINYGYEKEAQELIYRWLYMITRNAVDYNGTIPEKYDVVEATHKVFAEYGNVGTDFEYITQEGFGWMNASFQYGLSLLKEDLRKELNELTPPDQLFD
ncbi:hypothetical protein GCM10009117_20200 [Gangjinia marincola]|uniref:Neutral trehalase Ca2+ binding domain-containing protein n=1 Tax=Gangjinia marincola TaxID=578463 RepID=A0ABN1MI42_9FLAO